MDNNLAYDYDTEEEETKYEIIDGKICGLQPYEIIGGEKIIMSPAPNISHGIIVGRLVTIFNVYIEENNINAFVLADNADVYLANGSHFKPDVSVIVRKPSAINTEKFIAGSPDLVVEVLSESTKKNDFGVKKDAYEKYGTEVIMGSDAHIEFDIGNHSNSIKVIKENNFPEELVINSNVDKFYKYLNARWEWWIII